MRNIRLAVFVSLITAVLFSTGKAFSQQAPVLAPLPNNINFPSDRTFKQYQCDDEETIVYYGNGINTDWLRAENNSKVLNTTLKDYLTKNGLESIFGKYVVANSVSDTLGGFLKDTIFNVMPDASNLNNAQAYRWVLDTGSAPDWYQEELKIQLEKIKIESLRTSPAAGNHAAGYEAMLNRGRSSIVVGHSYGTILANLSYLGIEEAYLPGHAIVAAALMDNQISGADRFTTNPPPNTAIYRLPYTTIEEDFVARVFPGADPIGNLSANVNNWDGLASPTTGFFNGHGFEEDYLNIMAPGPGPGIPNASDRIMEDIVAMKQRLDPNPCHGHLLSGGSSTVDPDTGFTTDRQVAVNQSGAYRVNDYPRVPALTSSGLSEKLIDWRGQFVQGEASRVLTFRGPAARYNGPTTYANEIYRWGQLAYRPPQSVLGAAIQKDANGNEFVVAATHDASSVSGNYTIGNRVTVWRRDASLIDFSSAPYNAISNPLGWRRVLVLDLPNGEQVSPWFFNGSGTKAGAMRRELANRNYSTDRRKDPLCEKNPGIGGTCVPGEFLYEYPAGSYQVSELKRFTLEVPLPGSGLNGNVIFEQHESGDKAVLAVDYDDDREILLREVNNSPRGLLQDPDPDNVSDFQWLTLNGKSVFDQSSLDCVSASGICRTQRSQGISRNLGGFFASLGDIEKDPSTRNTYHVFYSDLRTETFAYSIMDRISGETAYWVLHEGKSTLLGKEVVGSQLVASYISARYGYEGDYRNIGPEYVYEDYTSGAIIDAVKVNPILGRYEVKQVNNIRVSNPPVAFGFDVAADKSLVATGILESGATFNIHSVIGDLNNYFANTNLSGATLLPMSVR